MIRLFVGLELDEDVQRRLAELAGGVPGAKWVSPPNFHLTLRFVGEIAHDRMEDLDDALAQINAPAFEMTLARAGYFGQIENARLLWVGVERNLALNHLQAKIESAVVRTGLLPEARKFTPHVSLARLKNTPPVHIARFVARHGLFREGPFAITHFTLFSSFLSHSGAIYTPEAHYPLTAPALIS
jgi:2'-5' RNA ligase